MYSTANGYLRNENRMLTVQTQQEWTELKPLMSLFPLATAS